MSENAIVHFVNYIKCYKNIKLYKDDSIVLISDVANLSLIKQIYAELCKVYHGTEYLLVNQRVDIPFIIKRLKNAKIGLLFFNDAEDKIDHLLGNNLFSPFNPLLEENLKKGEERKYFVFNEVNTLFSEIFSEPPEYYQKFNNQLIKCFNKALVSLCANNTILTFDLASADSWTSAIGLENSFYPGEIATYATTLSGKIDFTGLILSVLPFTQKYGLITSPITLVIEKSRLVDFSCDNAELYHDLQFYFSYAEKNNKVCEIGIGTNQGLKKLHPINCIAQERFSGFHLGFGGEASSSKQNDSIHLDFIFDKCSIKINNKIIFDGQFYI